MLICCRLIWLHREEKEIERGKDLCSTLFLVEVETLAFVCDSNQQLYFSSRQLWTWARIAASHSTTLYHNPLPSPFRYILPNLLPGPLHLPLSVFLLSVLLPNLDRQTLLTTHREDRNKREGRFIALSDERVAGWEPTKTTAKHGTLPHIFPLRSQHLHQ